MNSDLIPGSILHAGGKMYLIGKLLGRGKSGYSYLVNCGGNNFVLKLMHDEPCHYYSFEKNKLSLEIEAYKILSSCSLPIPSLIFSSESEGFLIKEYFEGPTVAEAVSRGELSSEIFTQIFEISKHLRLKNINIDYFPTNFVLCSGRLVYIDYELNRYSDEWGFEKWGIYYWINTEEMRNFLATGDGAYINHSDGKPLVSDSMSVKAQELLGRYSTD